MSGSSFKVLSYFLLAGVVALTGCGRRHAPPVIGPCVPVKGKVLLGEKPLDTGTVTFIPLPENEDVPRPKGYVDFNGFYELKTFGKEGAPPGKYRVTVRDNPTRGQRKPKFDPV